MKLYFEAFFFIVDHRDRQIAVVDGFGDPLQQKYRQAK